MRYHVIHIETRFAEEWQADVFAQQISDLGVDTIDGNDYYIPSELWQQNADEIKQFCAVTEGVNLVNAEECPDENWNATWEAEHPMQELPLGIRIVPHCAFGAGHHETTSLLINTLLSAHLTDKNVLDHGTGTGVLAIFAKRLGAAQVLALDIDDKSVQNAQENAALNNESIEVNICGPVLNPLTYNLSPFTLILANIHRNILLANMPSYAACLIPGGELWLSGFYEADIPALIAAAELHGLQPIDTLSNADWRLLKLARN